ncbi:hypothetical protein ACFWFI_02795 [Streptomyces sp. NPDC060209]|uniref:hypothetical protein n=1 Tax=Streptomyces sp. NPDC060209 TaxID=3347073 RepID=UPI0036519515
MTLAERKNETILRKRNRLRSAPLLLTALALTTAAGCSSGTDADATPGKSPAPVATTREAAPSVNVAQAAEAAAVDAYREYWKALEALYADPSGNTDQLKKVASGTAMVNAENDAKMAHDKGNLIIGSVSVTDSRVTASNIGRKVPKVALSSCLDITKWDVVKAPTKKPLPLPSTRLTKYVITSTLEKWSQGWVVIEDKPQGEAC